MPRHLPLSNFDNLRPQGFAGDARRVVIFKTSSLGLALAVVLGVNCADTPVEMRYEGRTGLVVGSLGFVALTAGVFWYQFHGVRHSDSTFEWDRLAWRYLPLILMCLPIETLAAALRTSLVARILEPGVTFWTCVKAECANVALNMLTPCHSGGGPAQVYIMSRSGVRVGTALTISLMSFVGTLCGLLSIGVYTFLWGDARAVRTLSVASVVVVGGIAGVMTFAAWWPAALGRALGRGRLRTLVDTYRDEARRFLRAGKTRFVWIYLLSLVFLFARGLLAYLCVRFLGIDAGSFRSIVEIQMALAFLVLFAPTPGGAGIAEGASLALMSGVVPAGLAPYYNLLWRFSTAYLVAAAGLVCVGRAVAEDAHRAMVRR